MTEIFLKQSLKALDRRLLSDEIIALLRCSKKRIVATLEQRNADMENSRQD